MSFGQVWVVIFMLFCRKRLLKNSPALPQIYSIPEKGSVQASVSKAEGSQDWDLKAALWRSELVSLWDRTITQTCPHCFPLYWILPFLEFMFPS